MAAEIIPTIRPLESLEPRLLTAQGRRTTVGSRKADREFEKRKVERRLLQELSKYFPPEQGQNMLSRSSLLSQGKRGHDHSIYDDLPLTSVLFSLKRSGGAPCPPRTIERAKSLSFDVDSGDSKITKIHPLFLLTSRYFRVQIILFLVSRSRNVDSPCDEHVSKVG